MNLLSRKSTFILFFTVFLGVGSVALFSINNAHAQTIGNVSPDGIDINSSPANPSPGANVTVSVQSYSTDLNRANISWLVDGKALTKGAGLKSISLSAPPAGKSTQVMAIVSTVEGTNVSKIITIKSGSVDIMWETSGYVPPFYRGKVPFAYQNTIRLIAMPYLLDKKGASLDPKNLIYKWQQDDQVLGNSSGYGKQTLEITGALIDRPTVIKVSVGSIDQSAQGESILTLTAIAPSLLLYEEDPLYGTLYNTAIADTFRLSHAEVSVVAVPFGFNIPQSESNFVYNWSVNNISQDNLTSSRRITLRTNAGQQGSSNISLSLSNTGNDILQSAQAAFTAVFNSAPKTNATTF